MYKGIYYAGTRRVRLSEYGAETAKRVWIRSVAVSAGETCRISIMGYTTWTTTAAAEREEKIYIIINCSLTNKETLGYSHTGRQVGRYTST